MQAEVSTGDSRSTPGSVDTFFDKATRGLGLVCFLSFVVCFYGPSTLFSRPLLWVCFIVGLVAASFSLYRSLSLHHSSAKLAVSAAALIGLLTAFGIPLSLLMIYGIPGD